MPEVLTTPFATQPPSVQETVVDTGNTGENKSDEAAALLEVSTPIVGGSLRASSL